MCIINIKLFNIILQLLYILIPIEFLKAGGGEAIRVIMVCATAYGKQRYDQMTGINQYMFLFTKKGDKKVCGNYRTIVLISHESKILLRILQKILETFLTHELLIEQAGFRRGR